MDNFIEKIKALKEEDVEVLIKTVVEANLISGKIKDIGEDYFVIEQKENEEIVYIKNVISISKLKSPKKPGMGAFGCI